MRVLTNFYSAPLAAGTEVEAKIHATYVEIWQQGQCVARHERCFGRQQKVLDLDHYLEALEQKPGALAGSTRWNSGGRRGRWPASFDRFWEVLKQRQGKQAGTRAMIDAPAGGTEARRGAPAAGHREGPGTGLFGYGRGRISAHRRTSGRSRSLDAVWMVGWLILRAAAADHGGLRSAAGGIRRVEVIQ